MRDVYKVFFSLFAAQGAQLLTEFPPATQKAIQMELDREKKGGTKPKTNKGMKK